MSELIQIISNMEWTHLGSKTSIYILRKTITMTPNTNLINEMNNNQYIIIRNNNDDINY